MSITASASTLPGMGSPLPLAPVTNLERMYALDEAWNTRDWETNKVKHPYDVLFGVAESTDGSAQ